VTVNGWLQLAIYVAVLTALVPLLGGYMARVYQGERLMLERPLGWLERLIYRVLGPSAQKEQDWKSHQKSRDRAGNPDVKKNLSRSQRRANSDECTERPNQAGERNKKR